MDYSLPQLFKTLIDQSGSDLHIAAKSPPRIRIDGQLIPLNLPALTPSESAELCYGVLNEEQKRVLEQEKEIDLAFSVKGIARFRANIFHDMGNISGAFRIIPDRIFTVEDLSLPPIIHELCSLPRGLVLVTGPTGSGKSTTLSAMINHINDNRYQHIVTIEDPIEFVHSHKCCMINQRELGDDTESFKRALKSVLRQDPDVVMIGELRDYETISAALTVAETGHLVFGTLHTNDCVSTLNRIVDAFPPHQQNQIKTQLAMSLEGVLSQLLLPANQGGRVMAMEIMRNTSAIKALIFEGKFNQIYSSIQSGQSESGMQTMNQALIKLMKSGYISKELAYSQASKKDEMRELLTKMKKTA